MRDCGYVARGISYPLSAEMAERATSPGAPVRAQALAIVGGGLAGLQCLRSMLKAGFTDIILLEESDTLGCGDSFKGLALQGERSEAIHIFPHACKPWCQMFTEPEPTRGQPA